MILNTMLLDNIALKNAKNKQIKMMRNSIIISVLILLLVACEKESEELTCNIYDTAVTGIAQVGGTSFCYDGGTMYVDAFDKDLNWSLGLTDTNIHFITVGVETENGIVEYGTTYTEFVTNQSYYRDEDQNLWYIQSGTFTIVGSKCPKPFCV